MEQVLLEAHSRKEIGKKWNKKLHTAELVPAIVYKDGKEGVNLQLKLKELEKVLRTSAGGNVLINLKITDEEKSVSKTVIVKEVQHNPLTGKIIHVDFYQISLTKTITVNVPLVAKGEAAGVKEDGGIMFYVIRELEIECLPTQIPKHIEVSVDHLRIGDSIHVKDLPVPSGVKVLNDPELTAISVEPPMAEEKVEAVSPEAEVTEPEVIKQKKEEEITTEEPEKAPKKEKAKEEK